MTIAYHSQNRKELVKAISEIIGIPAVYQFMPTCAYKIGECYTVTKSGDLEISDQADRKETERLLAELASRGYAVPHTSEPESKGLTVQMPADFLTEHTLGNLRQICENKAALFQAAFQTDSLDIISSDEKVEFPWFTVDRTVMQMPTAPSFPCSANLQRTRAASTASRTPPTIPSTPCGVS